MIRNLLLPPTVQHARLMSILTARRSAITPRSSLPSEPSEQLSCFNPILHQRQFEQVMTRIPMWRIDKATGLRENETLMISKIYNPNNETINELVALWNDGWKEGIDETQGEDKEQLQAALLINEIKMKKAFEFSWSDILIARVNGKIVGAIVGMPKDVKGEAEISTYNKTTWFDHQEDTFAISHAFGIARFCISVFFDLSIASWKMEGDNRNIAQRIALEAFWDACVDPYQEELDPHSRPSSLKQFIELSWALKQKFSNDAQVVFDIHPEDIDVQVVLNRNRSKLGSINIEAEKIDIETRVKYINHKLYFDECEIHATKNEVYIIKDGTRIVLADMDNYFQNDWDQMLMFHRKTNGCELPSDGVFPESRDDLISVGFNIRFRLQVSKIFTDIKFFKEFLRRLDSPDCYMNLPVNHKARIKNIIIEIVKDPQSVRAKMMAKLLELGMNPDDLQSTKLLYDSAFSFQKMQYLLEVAGKNSANLIGELDEVEILAA